MLPDVYVNQMTAYHPPTVLGNDFFEAILPTNDQWITTRTGIKTRPVMMNYSGHFPVTEIAKRACMKLFQTNGQKQDVDLLVFGGAIDELPYPSAGSLLSAELGLEIPTYHHKNACASATVPAGRRLLWSTSTRRARPLWSRIGSRPSHLSPSFSAGAWSNPPSRSWCR